jgi:hypothetical protein
MPFCLTPELSWAKRSRAIGRFSPMSYEAANDPLDWVENLDWIENNDAIEALLRDFTLEADVTDAGAGGDTL